MEVNHSFIWPKHYSRCRPVIWALFHYIRRFSINYGNTRYTKSYTVHRFIHFRFIKLSCILAAEATLTLCTQCWHRDTCKAASYELKASHSSTWHSLQMLGRWLMMLWARESIRCNNWEDDFGLLLWEEGRCSQKGLQRNGGNWGWKMITKEGTPQDHPLHRDNTPLWTRTSLKRASQNHPSQSQKQKTHRTWAKALRI